jgi:hypothetical protein
MNSVLDNGVEPRPARNYPVTDLLRTYLRQSRGVRPFAVGARREPAPARTATATATARTAEELWDYLGDFA